MHIYKDDGRLFGSWLEGLSGWAIAAIVIGSVAMLLTIATLTSGRSHRGDALAHEPR